MAGVQVLSLVTDANHRLATELVEASIMGSTRALVGAGGLTKRVLVAGEYVRVKLSGVPGGGRRRSRGASELGLPHTPDHAGAGGFAGAGGEFGMGDPAAEWRWGQPIIENLRRRLGIVPVRATLGGVNEADNTTWGIVSFKEPYEAMICCTISGLEVGSSIITAVPAEDTPGGTAAERAKQVVVSWSPGKSLGVGYLTFDSTEDIGLLLAVHGGTQGYRVGGVTAKLSKYEQGTNVVLVANLDPQVDDEVRVRASAFVLCSRVAVPLAPSRHGRYAAHALPPLARSLRSSSCSTRSRTSSSTAPC